MKQIFNIAKTEVKTFFCSPIAWLVLVVFIFQACSYFFPLFENQVAYEIMHYTHRNVTAGLFTSFHGVYKEMYEQLYFYIPLLTMGVMSRELANGSIKLLYSSPVTDTQVILGKYLGLLIYFFLMLGIFLLMILLTVISAPHAEFWMMIVGFFSIFLLVATYAAIGLFISSMTSYQIVAAVGTFAILYVLSFIGGVAQDVEWVRNVTYWLCIKGRGQEMLSGLFTTDAFTYFLSLIFLFVGLSIMRLNLGRVKPSIIGGAIRYIAIVAVCVAFGYFTSLPITVKAWDSTPNNRLSLSPETQKVMKAIDGPVTITTYSNILDKNYYDGIPKTYMADVARFRKYQIAKPDIKMKYIYYYDKRNPNETYQQERYKNKTSEELGMSLINAWRIDPSVFKTCAEMDSLQRIGEIPNLAEEEYRFFREVKAEKTGATARLRLYNDMFRHPDEMEYAAAFKRLITKNPPLVAFISGHGERSMTEGGDGNYYLFASALTQRYGLKNQGFNTTPIVLKEGEPISTDYCCVVLSDPRENYEPWEIKQIEDYIAAGGNMIVATDPRRIEQMRPIVAKLGVNFHPIMVVQPGTKLNANVIKCDFTEKACRMSSTFQYLKNNWYYLFADSASAIDFDPEKLEYPGFEYTQIAVTDSTGCWNEMEKFNFDDEDPVFNAAAGEEQLGNPCMFSCLRKNLGKNEETGKDKIQTIIFLSTANSISNGEFMRQRGNRSANFQLVIESFGWFTGGEFPVDTSTLPSKDNEFIIGSNFLFYVIKIFMMFVLPLFIAVWGVFFLRKRQKEL